MGVATREREIGGKTFRVTQLPAMRSLKLLNKLGKVIGPALARAGSAIGSPAPGKAAASLAEQEINFSVLGEAFAALFEQLADDAQFEQLLRGLLSTAVVIGLEGKVQPIFGGEGSGSTAVFDACFADHPADAYKLAAFSLEVNYEDFFGGLAGLKDRVLSLMAARFTADAPPDQSPSASAA